jgi:hypothetical protein
MKSASRSGSPQIVFVMGVEVEKNGAAPIGPAAGWI